MGSSSGSIAGGGLKKRGFVAGQVFRWLRCRKRLKAGQRELEKVKQEMETALLGDLWLSKEAAAIQHKDSFGSLDEALQNFIRQYSKGFRTLEDLLRTEAVAVRNTVVEESSKTREDVIAKIEAQSFRVATEQEINHLLESLRNPTMHARISTVKEPYPKTFAWIFDDSIPGRWHSFSSWLRSDQDRLYWISGKAGSGKSTLMKFILDGYYPQTRIGPPSHETPLRRILGEDALVVSFFLWAIGSIEQRTVRGILCGLLHDTLQSRPNRIGWLLEQTPALKAKRYPGDWSEAELKYVLIQSIASLSAPTYIFLDGLDEIDQDEGYERMIELVEVLLKIPLAKICVASRPEPALRDVYGKWPMLQLQDFNAKDITLYVEEFLYDHFRYLDKPQTPDMMIARKGIVETVLSKASGVFGSALLWRVYGGPTRTGTRISRFWRGFVNVLASLRNSTRPAGSGTAKTKLFTVRRPLSISKSP
ncbi:hypothetical protein B0T14DRAFT_193976 [Immersiella caudata]|uniref:Nephrocystin 3-like N-terminal domain-containing protein n=1 Tax=Immersiella caudata TaxID=314043 RepID=A0AA39WYX6_9PEZI|nr:hypothetical protein B0T14DRAFT_193976 [Immersiella caudata]